MLSIINKCRRKMKSMYWTMRVRNTSASCGEFLKVNGRSLVIPQTYLRNHVNMNGMRILGGGEVRVGDYFHSGIECMIITQNHNFDYGKEIP